MPQAAGVPRCCKTSSRDSLGESIIRTIFAPCRTIWAFPIRGSRSNERHAEHGMTPIAAGGPVWRTQAKAQCEYLSLRLNVQKLIYSFTQRSNKLAQDVGNAFAC